MFETFSIDMRVDELTVEYAECGSHELHVNVKLNGDNIAKLQAEILQSLESRRIELEKLGQGYDARTRVPMTDEETMGDYNTL
jgi:hypothetical protein